MSKFKVGDRVVYTGKKGLLDREWGICDKSLIGAAGKVIGDPTKYGGGEWDNGREWLGYMDGNMELEQVSQPAIDAHYTKYAIQPMEFSLANGLDAAQHTVIKYTVRYRDKGGIRDLRAAIRVLELMIEREEKAQANG